MSYPPLHHLYRRFLLAYILTAVLLAISPPLTFAQPQAQPPAPAAIPTQPATPTAPAPPTDPTDTLFNPPATTPVPDLDIQLTKDNLQRLRDDPRNYVPCTLFENGHELLHCGVKLKGAAGSFREVDDKPALTINTDKFNDKGEAGSENAKPQSKLFHGLEKFHLNNSVQDESLLNEWVCSEVFRSAGYPATRVAHARVSINGRDLGMYVLKEGFDKPFLVRNFGKAGTGDAALYDGGFLQDINADLNREVGKGKDEHTDLHRLAAACAGDNFAVRWADLDRLVDIDAFLRFMAIERIVGHWDGYTQNRNNYRVFFARTGPQGEPGKARVIPHGMDQTFNDTEFPLVQAPVGMLAIAIMRNPVWRTAYHAEIVKQAAAFDAPALIKKINALQARLQPALKRIDEGTALHQAQLARDLNRRLRARAKNIREQAAQPEPKPLVFTARVPIVIDNWVEANESEKAVLDDVEIDNAAWKRIACPPNSPPTIASWRRTLILPRGSYTLAADAKTEDVERIPGEDWRGIGAGIRISGTPRTNALTGSAQKNLTFDFDIDADREVVLVLELRAAKGSVAFKADSLKLTRAETPPPPKAP
jgi:hypothetical protein